MIKVSRRQLAKTVLDLLDKNPDRREDIIRSLAAYLIVAKRKKQLDLLIKDVKLEAFKSTGELSAEVTSTYGLTELNRKSVRDFLVRETGAKTVDLSEVTNPELLSGLIIRTADKEADMSARLKLKALANISTAGE